MKLPVLHEGRLASLRSSIQQVIDGLVGKVLIPFDVETTGLDPRKPWVQVTQIAAIAIDANTGDEIGRFSREHITLSVATRHEMFKQDRIKAEKKWPEGEPSIRELLDLQDYDSNIYDDPNVDISDYGDEEIHALTQFKQFIEQYGDKAVLIAHNAKFDMWHVNSKLPRKIIAGSTRQKSAAGPGLARGIEVLDTLEFARVYFGPVLMALMMQGDNRANKMGERMWDDSKGRPSFSLPSLSKALGVRVRKWHNALHDVIQLSEMLVAMIRFLRKNQNLYDDPNFKLFAAKAAQQHRAR